MQQAVSFGSVLEAVETLSLEEKETLIDILNHRVAENNRKLIIEEVQEVREDFLQGRCREASVNELMQEILA